MRSVTISVGVPEGETEQTWTLYVFRPAPHCREWTAYTPIRWRNASPTGIYYCGEVTVSAATLDRAKRAAIDYFKAIHTKGRK